MAILVFLTTAARTGIIPSHLFIDTYRLSPAFSGCLSSPAGSILAEVALLCLKVINLTFASEPL